MAGMRVLVPRVRVAVGRVYMHDMRRLAIALGVIRPMLANRAERIDFATRDRPDDVVKLIERSVPLVGIDWQMCRLLEHERFEQRLLAREEKRQQWIASAGALRPRRRPTTRMVRLPPRRRIAQTREDLIKRPFNQVH